MTLSRPSRLPRGAVAIGRLVGDVAAPAFKRHGMGHGEIASAWGEIVGPDLARISRPLRLAWPRRTGDVLGLARTSGGATLTIAVEGPRAIEMQHESSRIMEAVNMLFGYRAVTKLQFVQAPAGRGRRPRTRPPVTVADQDAATITGVHSPALRQALARLGAVAGSR